MRFRSAYRVLGQVPNRFGAAEIRAEPMLVFATPAYCAERGGPMAKAFVDILPPEWRGDDVRVNVRHFSMLPGWHSGVTGDYHLDVLMLDPDVQPEDMLTRERDVEFANYFVGGGRTMFAVGEVEIPYIHPGAQLWESCDRWVRRQIEAGAVREVEIPDGTVIAYGHEGFHRVGASEGRSERLFVQATRRRPVPTFNIALDPVERGGSDRLLCAVGVEVDRPEAFDGIEPLRALLDGLGVRATWYVHGADVERLRDALAGLGAAGHEVALLHPANGTGPAAGDGLEARLRGYVAAIEAAAGRRPVGYLAPWWAVSPDLTVMVARLGFAYDRSMLCPNFELYRASPPGRDDVRLLEIPQSYYRTDRPSAAFLRSMGNAGPRMEPDLAARLWRAQIDELWRNRPRGTFVLSLHPEVSAATPAVRAMLGALIEDVRGRPGARFVTLRELAAGALRANPAGAAISAAGARSDGPRPGPA